MTTASDKGYFTEADSAEVVIGRNDPTKNPRLAEVMAVIVRHLHAAVKEIEPTQEEWFAAIQFLTKTGHTCTDWRQEFILLSDILGVSMLVDAINSRRPTGATENTVLGPFHVADAPVLANGANICLDQKGEPMVVRGRVTDVATGEPLGGVTLDVWQANDEGFYDVQQKGSSPTSTCGASSGRRTTEPTGSGASSRGSTRFRTTGRWASFWASSAGIPSVPHTCTSLSRPMDTTA